MGQALAARVLRLTGNSDRILIPRRAGNNGADARLFWRTWSPGKCGHSRGLGSRPGYARMEFCNAAAGPFPRGGCPCLASDSTARRSVLVQFHPSGQRCGFPCGVRGCSVRHRRRHGTSLGRGDPSRLDVDRGRKWVAGRCGLAFSGTSETIRDIGIGGDPVGSDDRNWCWIPDF